MKACATCGSNQGPFVLVFPTIRVCGPYEFEKTKGTLIGRAAACLERRKKQEKERFGDPQNPYA